MRLSLPLLLAVAGCNTGYMSRSELLYDYPGPPPECDDGDATCLQVNAHLDGIRATIGDWCGTGRLLLQRRLVDLGEPAVPTLLRALAAEGWVRPHYAAIALSRMGHDADVAAWCRAHTEHDNFPWACQGLNPFALLARAGEL